METVNKTIFILSGSVFLRDQGACSSTYTLVNDNKSITDLIALSICWFSIYFEYSLNLLLKLLNNVSSLLLKFTDAFSDELQFLTINVSILCIRFP